jgi:polyisoprenoid-binding protein YceI
MAVSASPALHPGRLLPEGRWSVDSSRSRVVFTVRKLGAGTVRGRFADAAGDLVVGGGHVSASGSVRVAGVTTGNDERDAHLRAPGFFDAGAYPEITFASDSIVRGDDGRLRIRGNLTIRDRAREIELVASVIGGSGVEPRMHARTEIDRRDFGLTWNRAIEATGIVSNTVRIELRLQLTAARRSPSATPDHD